MKKRIAFIGLSYPLFYDYENLVPCSKNDSIDSPNPILESPLGLIIFFDELWFLNESVCPNNMRKLSYVKFIDQIFPDFFYEGAEIQVSNIREEHLNTEFNFILWKKNYDFIDFGRLYNRSHSIKIGDMERLGNCASIDNLIFDLCVLEGLRNISSENSIEFVSNSIYSFSNKYTIDKSFKSAEKIIIPRIPNYLSINGPYHESIDELRNSSYLEDYRKWVVKEHESIKIKEIDELTLEVSNEIRKKEEQLFRKEIDHNLFRFSLSTSKMLIGAVGGELFVPVVIVDTILKVIKGGIELSRAESNRWQGFILDADTIGKNIC